MTTTLAPVTARLIEYLTSIGGVDVHECVDDKGEPDPLAARRLAETLRARHAADLGHALTVVQSANRVVVTLIDDQPVRPARRAI
jgi:hypothetical protein